MMMPYNSKKLAEQRLLGLSFKINDLWILNPKYWNFNYGFLFGITPFYQCINAVINNFTVNDRYVRVTFTVLSFNNLTVLQ